MKSESGLEAHDLLARPATELVALLSSGRVSSLDLVQLHLDRIQRVNDRLHAVVQLSSSALDNAWQADQARAKGQVLGPLHGLPFTVKDWIEVDGARHGFVRGAEIRGENAAPAKRDATVVARMLEAGAVLLGITKAGSGAGIYPAPRNPYDSTRSPGARRAGLYLHAAVQPVRQSMCGRSSWHF